MSNPEKHLYEFGPFRLDAAEHLLLREGEPVPLTPKAFETLVALVRKSGRLVEKDELMKEVWPDTVVEENNLNKYISALRRALGEEADTYQYIETVPRLGYRFVASVTEIWDDNAELVVEKATKSRLIIEEEVTSDQDKTERAPFSKTRSVDMGPGVRSAESPSVSGPPRLRPISYFRGKIGGRRGLVIVSAAILVIAVVGIAYFIWSLRRPASTSHQMEIKRIINIGDLRMMDISPDGKYVAYVVNDAGHESLWVKHVATASRVRVIPPAAVHYGGLTFSHDGNYIYYIKKEDRELANMLYQVPILGGPSIKLKAGLDSPIALAPDGDRFAFVREYTQQGESALMVANMDGTEERKLIMRKLPDFLDYPAWSPDGKTVACTAISYIGDTHAEVVEVNAEGGAERRIGSRTWGFIIKLAWFRDNSGLVMSAKERGVEGFQIWQLSYPGGEARRITNDLHNYFGVSLTADSNALLTAQENQLSSIWMVSDQGRGRARQITPEASRFYGLSWTPDGKIVYAYKSGGNNCIWIAGADGTGQKQLTSDAYESIAPSVSPDGRSIFFVSDRTGTTSIWLMGIDGSSPQRLINASNEASPQGSPDGQWVVYTSYGSGKWSTLWKAPVAGGEGVQLISELSYQPVISPDGKLIACLYAEEKSSTQIGTESIAVVPFEGGGPVRTFSIPRTISQSAGLRWTSDGLALTYVNTRSGISNIWSQPLNGGPAKQLTDFEGERIFNFDWSRDGQQLACSRGTWTYDLVLISRFR